MCRYQPTRCIIIFTTGKWMNAIWAKCVIYIVQRRRNFPHTRVVTFFSLRHSEDSRVIFFCCRLHISILLSMRSEGNKIVYDVTEINCKTQMILILRYLFSFLFPQSSFFWKRKQVNMISSAICWYIALPINFNFERINFYETVA